MTPLSHHLSFVHCDQVKFRTKKQVKIKVCHSAVAVCTIGRGWGRGQMESGGHPSLFSALCLTDSIRYPFIVIERDFFQLSVYRLLCRTMLWAENE